MKAAVLVKVGKGEEAFEIRDISKPVPKENEVLIKVETFGLNFADVMSRRGKYKEAPPMPSVVGYEVVGMVEESASEDYKHLVGKRVVAFTRFGGYAEYAVTQGLACAEIGDINAGEACAIAVQYATAYYMCMDSVRLYEGDKVMVHAGAGGVGTALIQLCKLQGCEVFANAGSDDKLDYMKQQGADHVMNYRTQDYAVEIPKIIKKERLQATFNPIGGATYKKDFGLIGSGGKVMLFGASDLTNKKWGVFSALNFARKMSLLMPISLVMNSKSIMGINMLKIGDNAPKILSRCMKECVALLKEGKVKPHVGAEFQLEEIGKAHDLLESRKSMGKIVVHIKS
ncbi:zinc-binding dehydrogenase [Paracrocinitomix mangrovi]|uniref:quinone oxidoreductase family protein n=1 Tax=Paracrocinitomix mangrovi TaxID=2862509 RepID=UPI001C8E434D|nr:zinc-binding dehydrogenase [Paracrocinitomix mangrovi]UKN00489.1 zinc-binding dehydrogenase [Paracrocinitomix mangrovi]